MRPRFIVWIACLSLSTFAVADDEANGYDRWSVGASAAVTLPQGGARLRHVGGAALRFGYYVTEDWSVEGEAAWLEDVSGLGVQALWHLHGWGIYDDFFGYSRLDPFVTGGARGWIGGDCGQVGPKAGIGTFYHLTDSWSLRADADVTLGLEADCEMLYTVGIGMQYSF